MEHRFSNSFSATDIRAFEDFIENPKDSNWLPSPLDVLFAELHPEIKRIVLRNIRLLLAFQHENKQTMSYQDCSLGNLVFAGAYLEANSDFNTSVKNLSSLFGTPAQLINVSNGANRVLTALKENGEVLSRESEIVGPQNSSPITDIFFLENPLDGETKNKLASLDFAGKKQLLSKLHSPVHISPEADQVLRHADLIIYGPGTQFSSLMPSYPTKGLTEALSESTALVKIFIANLEEDHDIQGRTVSDLIDSALELMNDPQGQKNLITHIFSINLTKTILKECSWVLLHQINTSLPKLYAAILKIQPILRYIVVLL